jgi:hypothetical protein
MKFGPWERRKGGRGYCAKRSGSTATSPGEVHCIIHWSDYDLWMAIDPQWLADNEKKFIARFGEEDFKFVRSDHEDASSVTKSVNST